MGVVRIIGLGNEWAGDDAIGLVAAERLRERNLPGVEVATHEVPDWEMFENLQPQDLLIFIDACQSACQSACRIGSEPGTILELHADDVAEHGVRHCSSHGLGLAHWLSMAEVLGAKTGHVLIYAVEISDASMGGGLSDAVERAIPELLAKIESRITGHASGPV